MVVVMTLPSPAPPGPPHPSPGDGFRAAVALNPVAITWAVNTGLALAAGFGLHLDGDQAGAVTVILTSLVAITTALTARPWYIAGITGATAAALSAGAAFGLHLDGMAVTSVTAALSAVLMLLTHQAVIPVAAHRLGLTAEQILLGQVPANGRHHVPPPIDPA
jgi:hypothetical protein